MRAEEGKPGAVLLLTHGGCSPKKRDMSGSIILSAILAAAGPVRTEVEPPSGWDNLSLILSKPDNVPILMMIVLFSFYTYMALRDGFRNDRLIKAGRKQDVLKSMQE